MRSFMNIYVKLLFFLILNLTINTKIVTANELDNVGACTGVVIGNASVDFSLGDQQSFEDGIKIGITAYLSEVFANKYSKDDNSEGCRNNKILVGHLIVDDERQREVNRAS